MAAAGGGPRRCYAPAAADHCAWAMTAPTSVRLPIAHVQGHALQGCYSPSKLAQAAPTPYTLLTFLGRRHVCSWKSAALREARKVRRGRPQAQPIMQESRCAVMLAGAAAALLRASSCSLSQLVGYSSVTGNCSSKAMQSMLPPGCALNYAKLKRTKGAHHVLCGARHCEPTQNA